MLQEYNESVGGIQWRDSGSMWSRGFHMGLNLGTWA